MQERRLPSDNPYLLLTPGPLSTSRTVREAMLRDWCTWDDDYNRDVVQEIRRRLVELAVPLSAGDEYTTVLLQGSGTYCVEATLGSAIPRDGKLLVVSNGLYARRIARIAQMSGLAHVVLEAGDQSPPDLEKLERTLAADAAISHVAIVHGETSTGMLNPVSEVAALARKAGRTVIVDAMSTFGGVPLNINDIDWLVSSANKCIQGVPGFGFVVVRRNQIAASRGRSRSLSLDLYDQWETMERAGGKWRFTSPTHVVRAFLQALIELDNEGGVAARHARYSENQRILVAGMSSLGFEPFLPTCWHSPIITAFHEPPLGSFEFRDFYEQLKARGFVIYPGSITDVPTFRVGTIGEVFPNDIRRLLVAVQDCLPSSAASTSQAN